MLEKFDNDGVFTGNSGKNLFTIIVKDNTDVNSKSTKVGQHYHGISMTTMQFLSNEMLPPISKKVASVEAQYHCMNN